MKCDRRRIDASSCILVLKGALARYYRGEGDSLSPILDR